MWLESKIKPIKDLFPNEIDTELLLSVQLGKDVNGKYNEAESDKYDSYYWKITKAIEYNRPDWAFFMFIGNVQGVFNGSRISSNRLIKYFELMPKQFIDNYRTDIVYIFNFFDEQGMELGISLTNEFSLKKIADPLHKFENN